MKTIFLLLDEDRNTVLISSTENVRRTTNLFGKGTDFVSIKAAVRALCTMPHLFTNSLMLLQKKLRRQFAAEGCPFDIDGKSQVFTVSPLSRNWKTKF